MVADGSWGVGVGYILGPLSDDRYTHSTHLVCSSLTSFLVPDHKIEYVIWWMCSCQSVVSPSPSAYVSFPLFYSADRTVL